MATVNITATINLDEILALTKLLGSCSDVLYDEKGLSREEKKTLHELWDELVPYSDMETEEE